MPDHLSNKIAAGEVVERPASVVKELVENSIDANSTWVKVDLYEAGLQQLSVTDNGEGMREDDCERSFFRHATSKIRDENDLFHVATLGFRGEALASIAGVSRLSIKTSPGNEAGTQLELEGGKLMQKDKSDARQGTEITVNDLFFNTPARLKYMKTIHTELGHITDVLNRMALAYPDVKFSCTHNDKQLFQTSGRGDLLQVIAQIYGAGVARKMIPVTREDHDFKLTGYIAKPEITRASRSYMTTMINQRYIKNVALNKAILKGYHTLLPIGRYPLVVLNVEMAPILVDVNVHPAKLEVRFSKEKELFELTENAIRDAFRQETLIPEYDKPPTSNHGKSDRQVQYSFALQQESEKPEQQHVRESHEQVAPASHPSLPNAEFVPSTHASDHESEPERLISSYHEASTDDSITDQDRVPAMYPIGQLHGTYILAQNETGFYIVDQHAAQERIKYEFYKEKIGEIEPEVQELLVPMTFEFSKQEALKIEEYKDELHRIGVFLEPFGDKSYRVSSHPQWFPKDFEQEVIQDMIDQLMAEDRIDVHKLREEAAILMSCKRSIKANHYLNHQDMQVLLEELRRSTDPFTCPHGRPIIVSFSTYEMEKMFKRVM
ncbi:DNA mismatch repair endonuclease MutL [Thalassobacillus sp. CUG 92003]|uniref:DNA mismatch repair endonuclease MutL n=1 Tax=Thalassobacillus sp. CUG 92003 TaxID=2736641 RepID=UPI001C63A98E